MEQRELRTVFSGFQNQLIQKKVKLSLYEAVEAHRVVRETSRLPHSLDNRLRDGGEVVSLTGRPFFTPKEALWYSFLLEAESTPEP
jgi:hypothetical protein